MCQPVTNGRVRILQLIHEKKCEMRREYKTTTTGETDYAIYFKEGKLVILNDGRFVSLDSPIVLQNGIIITTDGTIRFLDGSNKRLLEGETFHTSFDAGYF